MEKVVLKDETEIEIINGATENCIKVSCSTAEEAAEIASKFTDNNLVRFSILTEDGQVCTTLTDKQLDKYTIYLTEKVAEFIFRDVDTVTKRLAELEATQEMQDEAITELAGIVAEGE